MKGKIVCVRHSGSKHTLGSLSTQLMLQSSAIMKAFSGRLAASSLSASAMWRVFVLPHFGQTNQLRKIVCVRHSGSKHTLGSLSSPSLFLRRGLDEAHSGAMGRSINRVDYCRRRSDVSEFVRRPGVCSRNGEVLLFNRPAHAEVRSANAVDWGKPTETGQHHAAPGPE